MTIKERYNGVIEYFKENMPSPKTELHYSNPYELLVAVILSAQCTDKRINMVTPALFKAYPSPFDLAKASIDDIFEYIKSVTFPNNKAKSLLGMANMLVDNYNGEVPSSIDELVKIPGVGRKTANVIRGNIYNQPSIVVDTHVKRISKRLGFTKEDDPEKIEFELMRKLPKEHWILYNIQIISFGRNICFARSPKAR